MNLRLLLLLLLPALARSGTAAPPELAPRPYAGGWMDLLDGATYERADALATARPEALDTQFTRYGEAPETESGHGLLAVYNDTGWLLVVRHDDTADKPRPDGRIEIFIATRPDAPAPDAPHHLVLDFDDHGPTNRMVDRQMYEVAGIEERERRTGPAIVQHGLLTEGYAYEPLDVAFRTFPRPGGGFYTTFFFRWGRFAAVLPDGARGAQTWRFKIIRMTPGGTRFVWGVNPHPHAGHGVLRWPAFRSDFLADIYRQWLTTGYGADYVAQKDRLHACWTVSRREQDYGFLTVAEPTFEPRNPTSDALFVATALDPLIHANQKLADAVYKPRFSPKPLPVLSMPEPVRKLIFAELPRLRTFRDDVDARRRDFLLNCLLGRAPQPPPPRESKETDITETGWDAIDAAAGNVNIDLDDTVF